METTTFKGVEITREDILRAMRIFDEELRSDFAHWRTHAIEHEGKLYPTKETLRIAAGRDIGRFWGGESTNRHFRELGFKVVKDAFPLTEMDDEEKTDEILEEAIDTSLLLERDLERILVTDLSQLEPGLQLYKGRGFTGQQIETGEVGRIDILALDTFGNFVVIELKAGEANDRVCGQILRYMGWVKENLAGERTVRGIIVASEFDQNLRLASSVIPDVLLKKYEVSFKFKDVSSSNE
jgi:hypothetical protein